MSKQLTACCRSSACTPAGSIVTCGATWRSSRSQAAGSGTPTRARNSGGSDDGAADTRLARAAEAAKAPTVAQRRDMAEAGAGEGRADAWRSFMVMVRTGNQTARCTGRRKNERNRCATLCGGPRGDGLDRPAAPGSPRGEAAEGQCQTGVAEDDRAE